MTTEIILCIVIIILLVVLIILSAVNLFTKGKTDELMDEIRDFEEDVRAYTDKNQKDTLEFLEKQLRAANENTLHNQTMLSGAEGQRFSDFSDRMNENIGTLRKTINENNAAMDRRFAEFRKQTNEQMIYINGTMERKVSELQAGNEKKLEEMRRTVDEKLQKTLEDRISQSFRLVSERLEQVYTSLGEMQKVGAGVEDLKKVLSNVKTRGILGEVQLGAILEEILSPEQYDTNVITKKGSNERVEYAVKMPGGDNGFVYLPIDAKFPLDAYRNLMDAYDSGDAEKVSQAVAILKSRIKSFAKDIATKYIDVPNTTEFAIMFLPLEGLYAEVVRRGLVEELQKEKINVAGPTTMAALLNSLQMGFRTLAIQKSSGQVWKVLEEVKTEFSKFGDVLASTQRKMQRASDDLDKLIGTRTNAIQRKLRDVSDFVPDGNSDGNAALPSDILKN